MNRIEKYQMLIQEIDFVLAEQRALREQGVHLIVEHLCHVPGTICAPGEMIGDILLAGTTSRSFGFSGISLLLMDCLCRYRQPLSAEHIERIMATDPFYVHYAANRIGRKRRVARPDRRAVHTYVPRIRDRMATLLSEVGLNLDPHMILSSQASDTNTVVYRLNTTRSLVHISK